MSYGALGLIEVLGSTNAILVVDKLLKTAEVEYRTWNTKCGGHVTVFVARFVTAISTINVIANHSAEWCGNLTQVIGDL